MKKKKRTINVNPFNMDVQIHGNGNFILKFESDKKKINIQLERWWVIYIARILWKIIDTEKKEISKLETELAFQKED